MLNEQLRITDNVDEQNVPDLQPRISSRHPAQFRTPAYSATTLFFGRFIGDPGKREIARGITLLAGLSEQGRQTFRQRGVNRILSRELFGCGAEKSQTGNQFQGVGLAAHEIFDGGSRGQVVR